MEERGLRDVKGDDCMYIYISSECVIGVSTHDDNLRPSVHRFGCKLERISNVWPFMVQSVCCWSR